MISLLYEPLPETITADGREIGILTDFRAWLQFLGLIGDRRLHDAEKIAALSDWLLHPEPVTAEIVRALADFCKAGALEPDKEEGTGEEPGSRPPRWDWDVDAQYVLGDFRRYYSMDLLRIDYLHWWEFRALFAALPEDSASFRRIGIRSVNLSEITDKKQKRRFLEMQRRIALPFEMDDGDIGAVFASMMG